jgi:hypothetical protein
MNASRHVATSVFPIFRGAFYSFFYAQDSSCHHRYVTSSLFFDDKKKSFQSLDVSVFWLLRYLPLFIIPAATGIITQIDTISKELLAITVALFVSTLLSLALSAKMMDMMITYKEKRR